MKKTSDTANQNLDGLFEKYRRAPESYVFVPLADACRKIARLEEALEICEQGVARHPDYASGHVVKGKCHYDQGDFEAARQSFEKVLTLDDNNLVALKFLGTIEADAGHLDIAQRYLERILAIDPENKEIKTILRDVEDHRQDRTEDRVPDVEDDVEELDGDDITAGDGVEKTPVDIGIAADRDNEPVDESPASLDGIETSEELASITLADIFASQGYSAKAAKIYREVLKKQPDNQAVRQRLDDLQLGSGQINGLRDEDDLAAAIDDLVGDVDDENVETDQVVGDIDDENVETDQVVGDTDDEDAGTDQIVGEVEDKDTGSGEAGGEPLCAPEIVYATGDTTQLGDVAEDGSAIERLGDGAEYTIAGNDSESQTEDTESPEHSRQAGGDEANSSGKGSNGSKDTAGAAPRNGQSREIDENDSLGHFARWLKQIQK